MRVLVVLPTYNEAANIATVLERVRIALPDASVLVVDDNSPDGTGDIVEKSAVTLEQIPLLRRPGKSGLGSAYRDGFRWGLARGFDVLVEMDSDLSHDPDALGLARRPDGEVTRCRSVPVTYPVARFPAGRWPGAGALRGGNLYADLVLGSGYKDSTAGFRAYAATFLRRIDLDSVRANSYGFQVEMTYRALQAGARLTEVPIRVRRPRPWDLEDVDLHGRGGAPARQLVGAQPRVVGFARFARRLSASTWGGRGFAAEDLGRDPSARLVRPAGRTAKT